MSNLLDAATSMFEPTSNKTTKNVVSLNTLKKIQEKEIKQETKTTKGKSKSTTSSKKSETPVTLTQEEKTSLSTDVQKQEYCHFGAKLTYDHIDFINGMATTCRRTRREQGGDRSEFISGNSVLRALIETLQENASQINMSVIETEGDLKDEIRRVLSHSSSTIQ